MNFPVGSNTRIRLSAAAGTAGRNCPAIFARPNMALIRVGVASTPDLLPKAYSSLTRV